MLALPKTPRGTWVWLGCYSVSGLLPFSGLLGLLSFALFWVVVVVVLLWVVALFWVVVVVVHFLFVDLGTCWREVRISGAGPATS